MEEIPISESNTIKEETLSALEVLGYSRKSSEKVVDNLIRIVTQVLQLKI